MKERTFWEVAGGLHRLFVVRLTTVANCGCGMIETLCVSEIS